MNNSLGGSYFPKTDVVTCSVPHLAVDWIISTITTIPSVVHCSLGIRLYSQFNAVWRLHFCLWAYTVVIPVFERLQSMGISTVVLTTFSTNT